MKKIRLDLDSLKVQSFVTNERAGRKEGTVFGMLNTICDETCNGVSETCRGHEFNCEDSDLGVCHHTDPLQTTCQIGGGEETYFGCLPDTGTGCETEGFTCDVSCEPCAESCDSIDCQPE